MSKVTLSYSTISNCLQPTNSHNWKNKMMGRKPEEKPWFNQGKDGHRIIQRHISGVEVLEDLANIKYKFPIVEKKDFDENTKFTIDINSKFDVIGYVDAINPEELRLGEIKLSSTPWSMQKFMVSMQRKIYGLAFEGFLESVLVTGPREPKEWKNSPVKVYAWPFSQKDRDDAMKYIMDAIAVVESGVYDGGLEDGICTDPRCYYGENCFFKHKH